MLMNAHEDAHEGQVLYSNIPGLVRAHGGTGLVLKFRRSSSRELATARRNPKAWRKASRLLSSGLPCSESVMYKLSRLVGELRGSGRFTSDV